MNRIAMMRLEEDFCACAKQLYKAGSTELSIKGLLALALDEAADETVKVNPKDIVSIPTTTTSEDAYLPVFASTNRKTPEQWSAKFGVQVMDADGWNRASEDWKSEWNHPITQDMFISRFQRSTTRVVDREKYQMYIHLFQ